MGRKRTGKGKCLYICIASLILFLNLTGCAYIEEIKKGREARELLADCRAYALIHEYKEALIECEKVLSLSPDRYPADEALYTMAVIYLDPENPEQDFTKAVDILKKIEREFSKSKYAYDAAVWSSIINKVNKPSPRRGDLYLGRIKVFFKNRNYADAVKENQRIINISSHPRRAHAIYNMGLIYADLKNPQRDFGKAIMYFERVMKEYPESIFALRARIWRDMLISIEKSKQIDIEIEKKKKELIR